MPHVPFEDERGDQGPLKLPAGDIVFEMVSPAELSLATILDALSGPTRFVELILDGFDRRLTMTQLEAVMERWLTHHGLVGGKELARLMFVLERYGAEIEWDLQRELRVDVGQLWRDRHWRKLLSWIDQLPRATRYHQAVGDDEEHAIELAKAYRAAGQEQDGPPPKPAPPLSTWTPEVELLTGLLDQLAILTWTMQNQNADNPSKPPPRAPKPVTALQRVLARMAKEEREEQHSSLVSKFAPHLRNKGDAGA